MTGLPDLCPLKTNGYVPMLCRYDPMLFKRLVKEKVLPMNCGCPLAKVCGLKKQGEK